MQRGYDHKIQQPVPHHSPTSIAQRAKKNIRATSASSTASSSAGDNITVCVRIRPMNAVEKKRGDRVVTRCLSDGRTLQIVNFDKPKNIKKNFKFDLVLDERVGQPDLFESCAITDLVDMAMQGYSTTIFAYGQTGSGKTHTIVGKEDAPGITKHWGIIPRAGEYIFEQINKFENRLETGNTITRFKVRANFLEVYNEQVNDLLNMNAVNLPVRQSHLAGFFVENSFIVEIQSFQDLMDVLQEGLSNRKVGVHELNKDSSRSHSIFTVYVDIMTTDKEDGFTSTKYGKIVFVDLAGSERLKESLSTGDTAKETGHINKSLFTLSKVISILGDPKKAHGHVPYRDSKLTKLLKDSLGGKCKTLMIATITPSSFHLEETLSTIMYAGRAKNIKNKPTINMNPNEQLILHLREEIKQLRSELAYYKQGGGGGGGGGLGEGFQGPQGSPPHNQPKQIEKPEISYIPKVSHSDKPKRPGSLGIKLSNPLHPQSERKLVIRQSFGSPRKDDQMMSPVNISTDGSDRNYYPTDPRYAKIIAENERLEQEVKDLKNLLYKSPKDISDSIQEPKRLSKYTDEDVERVQAENIELTEALHKLKQDIESNSGDFPSFAISTNANEELIKINTQLQERIMQLNEEISNLKNERSIKEDPAMLKRVIRHLTDENNFLKRIFKEYNIKFDEPPKIPSKSSTPTPLDISSEQSVLSMSPARPRAPPRAKRKHIDTLPRPPGVVFGRMNPRSKDRRYSTGNASEHSSVYSTSSREGTPTPQLVKELTEKQDNQDQKDELSTDNRKPSDEKLDFSETKDEKRENEEKEELTDKQEAENPESDSKQTEELKIAQESEKTDDEGKEKDKTEQEPQVDKIEQDKIQTEKESTDEATLEDGKKSIDNDESQVKSEDPKDESEIAPKDENVKEDPSIQPDEEKKDIDKDQKTTEGGDVKPEEEKASVDDTPKDGQEMNEENKNPQDEKAKEPQGETQQQQMNQDSNENVQQEDNPSPPKENETQ